MTTALQRWARLVDEVNGRGPVVGQPGVRDPEYPCSAFEPGKPTTDGDCETDGHYLCDECVERATCPDCGLRPWHCYYDGCGAVAEREARQSDAALAVRVELDDARLRKGDQS